MLRSSRFLRTAAEVHTSRPFGLIAILLPPSRLVVSLWSAELGRLRLTAFALRTPRDSRLLITTKPLLSRPFSISIVPLGVLPGPCYHLLRSIHNKETITMNDVI